MSPPIRQLLEAAAEAAAPAFRSALQEVIGSAKQTKAPARQWLATLQNAPGVKKDELQSSGVAQLLASRGDEPVTRDELASAASEGGVRLSQKTLSDGPKLSEGQMQTNREMFSNSVYGRAYTNLHPDERAYIDQAIHDEIATGNWDHEDHGLAPGASQGMSKFSQYQLPGGANYREVLTTLPTPDWLYAGRKDAPSAEAAAQVFRSSHYPDDPNILFHRRMNDRTTADGARALHLEEVQSDWHQQGRQLGYQSDDEKPVPKDLQDIVARVWPTQADRNPNTIGRVTLQVNVENGRLTAPEAARLAQWEEQNPWRNPQTPKKGVPDAPFKNTWHELAMKQSLADAVAGNYDALTWTTGAQQVDRYNQALRKSVDELHWTKTPDGIHLKGYKNLQSPGTRGPNLNNPVLDTTERESALSDAVGKALAQQIISDPNPSGKIAGRDIRIDDTGMSEFYDRMLPQFLNKYAKKYGGKVETARVGGSLPPDLHEAVPEEIWNDMSPDERQATIENDFPDYKDPGQEVHSLRITPQLRAFVKSGQPLFAVPLAAGAVADRFSQDPRTRTQPISGVTQ